MDEFGSLAKDFGFRPQGKSAPMKSSDRRTSPLSSDGNDMFHDVFGGPPKYTKTTSSMSDFDYDSIFKANNNNSNNSPVYDKPLYDDDVFDNMPGVMNNNNNCNSKSDNIFESSKQSDQFDDLFGDFGRTEKAEPNRHRSDKSSEGFDDLIPGFGSSSSPASNSRWNSDPSPTSTSNTREKSNTVDDPFVVLESTPTPVTSSQSFFTDPLEQFSNIGKSKSTKSGVTSPSGDVFADMDPLNTFDKSPPASSKETQTHNRKKGPSQTHSEEGSSVGSARSSVSREPFDEYSFGFSESQPQKMPFDHFQESHQTSHTGTSSNVYTSPKSEEHVSREDDIWLTVSEIPLFTQITRGPPPSRPPPPIPARASTTRTFDNDFSSSSSYSTKYANPPRSKEPVHDEDITHDELERERAEEEKEKIKEIEREKARQAVEKANREARERAANEARLKAERAAVQRVQTEARERAAVEARERAERAAAERAAAEKAAADRAAAEKAAAEAKEKETREKEKAAVAKAQAEARRRAERAAVERVTAEARERAAAEARERAATAAATAAKVNQQRNDDDLDSFFSMGSQPNTVPKARTSSNDSATDPLSQDRRGHQGAHRASSSAVPSNVKKASSSVNFVDDLSSIFGAGMPAGEFQDIEGETEERRRARLERQQRTQERAAKALAEKNHRDLQVQKEQEERHRISATLDVEIKRWASGKEGNLRAMLSTLQYVLWPGCGWQPVALTDLITGANVKRVYRKATLCIHPDKVQQKGANLQQKYVAEKVFDLLKEAWNKFNSEELF